MLVCEGPPLCRAQSGQPLAPAFRDATRTLHIQRRLCGDGMGISQEVRPGSPGVEDARAQALQSNAGVLADTFQFVDAEDVPQDVGAVAFVRLEQVVELPLGQQDRTDEALPVQPMSWVTASVTARMLSTRRSAPPSAMDSRTACGFLWFAYRVRRTRHGRPFTENSNVTCMLGLPVLISS
ncbi:hypothetical protein WP39_29710 [Streptomyces sp. 604F]|nr:hypothetical protein [Streptomyces sp. 604F]